MDPWRGHIGPRRVQSLEIYFTTTAWIEKSYLRGCFIQMCNLDKIFIQRQGLNHAAILHCGFDFVGRITIIWLVKSRWQK